MTTVALSWRKSSHSGGGSGSGNGGDCVEVALGPAGTLLRDSKGGEHGPVLRISRAAFGALLESVSHRA